MMSRLMTLLTAVVLFQLMLWAAVSPKSTQATPMGRHCGDVGPLPLDDPDFCGCTWGDVLFQGEPVAGALLLLEFNGQIITTTTMLVPGLEPFPFYDVTAHDLGARRGDTLTLTAVYAGQTISRTIRAWPDADGEQFVTLAFPETGVWEPLVSGGYTRTLTLDGNTLWAGGPTGLLSVNLSNGSNQPHPLPWGQTAVRDLTVTPNGRLWVASAAAVAEWDGANWQTYTLPFSDAVRALASHASAGTVWVGGGDGIGYVAQYDGAWQIVGSFANAPVTALTVDSAGLLWAGTWGRGVYRQDGHDGWINYRVAEGLPSDNVLSLAAGDGQLWVGTSPYLTGQGPRGGVGRYDLATGEWRRYGVTDGLPPDATFPQAAAAVHDLAVGSERVWAATELGLYFSLADSWWGYRSIHGLPQTAGWAVIAVESTAVATLNNTLYRLYPGEAVGERPTAIITTHTTTLLTRGYPLILHGEGYDNDEDGERLVGWEWSVDNGRLLCVKAACNLPFSFVNLDPGEHFLMYRVQDDEGLWSDVVIQTLTVSGTAVFLPFVHK